MTPLESFQGNEELRGFDPREGKPGAVAVHDVPLRSRKMPLQKAAAEGLSGCTQASTPLELGGHKSEVRAHEKRAPW